MVQTEPLVEKLSKVVGISSICNILGAIKTAKYYEMGEDDDCRYSGHRLRLTRYGSVMDDMREAYGVSG